MVPRRTELMAADNSLLPLIASRVVNSDVIDIIGSINAPNAISVREVSSKIAHERLIAVSTFVENMNITGIESAIRVVITSEEVQLVSVPQGGNDAPPVTPRSKGSHAISRKLKLAGSYAIGDTVTTVPTRVIATNERLGIGIPVVEGIA